MGESEGVLKEKDGNIIENILHLNSIKVKDIFTPRKVMFTLSLEDLKRISQNKIDNDLELEKLKEYSRVPIYDKNIDDIVGVLLSKEFFFDYIKNTRDIEKLVKPVYSVNENISVSRLLDLFLKKKEHLFMVVDNFGQTEGIVTLEDAMETVLGQEIIDELDKNIDLREIAKNS